MNGIGGVVVEMMFDEVVDVVVEGLCWVVEAGTLSRWCFCSAR